VKGADAPAVTVTVDVITAAVGRHDDVVTGVAAGVTRAVIIVTDATDVLSRTEVVVMIVALVTRDGRAVLGVPLDLR
jgi:hypothetical protein